MHQTLTFPDIPLTEEMAKLLFYSCLAEPHSIRSTGKCYLHAEIPLQGSTDFKDFKGQIIYKNQYKSFENMPFSSYNTKYPWVL